MRTFAQLWADSWEAVLFYSIGLFLVILVGGGFWAGKSYFEARAFNRATGAHVSTWDAMFVELRVQAAPLKVEP